MEIIWPGQNLAMPFSPAIKVDGKSSLLFVSATDARHAPQDRANPSSEAEVPADPAGQAGLTMESVAAILKAAGASTRQLVQRVNYVRLSAGEDWRKLSGLINGYYGGHKPTSTQVRVRRLARPGLTWQLSDLVAAMEDRTEGKIREPIHPDNQYREEPFAHAVRVGGAADLIYVSGLSATAGSGLAADAAAQTRMAMDQVLRVLKQAGGELADLVHMGVYVKSFDDETAVRHALREYLGKVRPAGKVAEAAMETDDLLVKIEAVAAVAGSGGKPGRQNIEVEGSVAKGVRVSRGRAMLFVAGTVALPLVHTHPPQPDEGFIPSDLPSQAKKTFHNIGVVLRHAGASFEDVFKLSRYMRNPREYTKVDEAMAGCFAENRPGHTDIGVCGLVRENLLLEVSSLAMIP